MTDTPQNADLGSSNGAARLPIVAGDRLPATPADVSAARLPATYEAARRAIEECARVDECKSWADKAAALASYARQANDDSLRVLAVRIQDRAMRRAGELLKQVPRGDADGVNLVQNRRAGTDPPVNRTSAAGEAGLSDRQRKTALRLASIPEPEFTRQVEGPNPPTVTRLAEQGKVSRGTSTAPARGLAGYSRECEALAQFVRFCERNDPAELARGIQVDDIEAVRQFVAIADRWLDRFVTSLAVEN